MELNKKLAELRVKVSIDELEQLDKFKKALNIKDNAQAVRSLIGLSEFVDFEAALSGAVVKVKEEAA